MTRAVAVGVGGTGGGQALAWASEQALRTASPLALLHRGPLGRSRTGDVPLTVTRRARCPVAVVPAHGREGEPS